MTLKEKREKKIKEMAREAIRNAVITVMSEEGPDGLTMARVAEEAGVAKGTLYLYYKNKKDLLEDTINWCFMPLIEGAKEIFVADLEPDEKISELITFHHKFFEEHQRLFSMLLLDQQCERSSQKKQKNEHYREIVRKFSDLIQDGIDKGIFKQINPMAAAIIIMESSMQLTYQFLKQDNEFDLNSGNSANILKEIFLKGILTR